MGTVCVVVPIRSFGSAKQRLRDVVSDAERAALAASLAAGVLDAAGRWPALVVTGDAEVRAWASSRGAAVVEEPGAGLDVAVGAGIAAARRAGFGRAVVIHADVPLASGLPDRLGLLEELSDDVVLLVPDRHRDGTNVLSLATAVPFRFAYGRGSFAAHLAHCHSRGLVPVVRNDAALSLDIDTPADLDEWHRRAPHARRP